MPQPIKIAIIDDHDDVREALAARLCAVANFVVVGQTGNAEEGLLNISACHPDVVLVETKRTDGRGLEIVNWIANRSQGPRVIVLTSYPSEWEKWAAYRAGAARYLLKEIGSPDLIHEIQNAATARAQ